MSDFIVAFILVAVTMITLFIWNLSLSFRHSYLRQKCLNRMDEHEIKIMDETDKDFWSFVK